MVEETGFFAIRQVSRQIVARRNYANIILFYEPEDDKCRENVGKSIWIGERGSVEFYQTNAYKLVYGWNAMYKFAANTVIVIEYLE